MTPAEHYAAAERVLEEAREAAGQLSVVLAAGNFDGIATVAQSISLMFARAQVHATLATVADRNTPAAQPVKGPSRELDL